MINIPKNTNNIDFLLSTYLIVNSFVEQNNLINSVTLQLLN